MNKSQFIRRLKTLVAWDEEPRLTDDDIETIADQARKVDSSGYTTEQTDYWEANTAYWVGDLVVPTTSDGYTYKVTTAGVSGASEPTFVEGTTNDGTIVWTRSDRGYWTPSYDLNYAAFLGWELKAAKAASRFQVDSEGAVFHREQYIAHCLTMKKQFAAKLNYSARC